MGQSLGEHRFLTKYPLEDTYYIFLQPHIIITTSLWMVHSNGFNFINSNYYHVCLDSNSENL